MILKQYNVYCHCNFGWGGDFDGWYLYQSSGDITFDCNGYPNFEYDILTMISKLIQTFAKDNHLQINTISNMD